MASIDVKYASVQAGPDISLSLRLYKPQPASAKENLVIVLVHQYTVLGGCQGLLKGMASNLASKGYLSITFDMRGAGRSTGKPSWTGSAEVQDVVAVCRWVLEQNPASRILLVGSSAGAPIAGSAVDQVEQVVGYVGLGYPFGWFASVLFGRHNKSILESPKPKLFVMGTKDGFTSVKQLNNKLQNAAGIANTRLMPGVGHFQMEGPQYDDQISEIIAEFAVTL